MALKLISKDLAKGSKLDTKFVFKGMHCNGDNISPELVWKNVPKNTKSFAITLHDPDAPTASGWWHWIAYDIPADITEFKRGASENIEMISAAIKQARNDYGYNGYGGACPPVGDHPHRYVFTIHALNIEHLDVSEDSSASLIHFNINAHTIEKDSIMSIFWYD